MNKFTKDFKTPDPVPQDGIEAAIQLMKTGRMYRYNFQAEIHEETESSLLDGELACEVAKLESEFRDYTGHKYAIAVNSCGSALFLALKAAGVKFQDKVFSNAFTFTAVPSSIVHAGGVPVYLECNQDYLVDVDDLKTKIKANTDAKFLIVSHMRGHIADMDAIKEICERSGIYLIEDCAHSLGAKWYDPKLGQYRQVGHHGQIACFSSQSYKMLNSGEGGFVCTNDEKIAAYCILASGSYETLYKKHMARPFNDDLFEELKPNVPNFSLRMSNLTAAVLRPQIPHLEEKIALYNQRYDQLAKILAPVKNIYIPSPLQPVIPARYSLQFTLLDLTKYQIDKIVKKAEENGVKIQIFGRLDNSMYFKNWQYSFEELPLLDQTDRVISCTCDLRLSLSFDEKDIALIGCIIKDALYKTIKEDKNEYYQLTENFQGIETVISTYDDWAASYDEYHRKTGWIILLNYLGYTLISYLKSADKILDVGCGTGLLGEELSAYGFNNLYGADISKSSLALAEKLGIYQGLYEAELGNPLDFEDDSFDAWVSTGAFTRNQVPLNAFEELIRILKPNGLLVVVLRVEDNDFYYNKLKEYYARNTLQEVCKEKVTILRGCNHELVIARKQG